MNSAASEIFSENIVQRLKNRVKEAQQLGFHVRFELLNDQQPSWCELGRKKVLFLDLSHTANEQLRCLNEMLDSFNEMQSNNAPNRQSSAA